MYPPFRTQRRRWDRINRSLFNAAYVVGGGIVCTITRRRRLQVTVGSEKMPTWLYTGDGLGVTPADQKYINDSR